MHRMRLITVASLLAILTGPIAAGPAHAQRSDACLAAKERCVIERTQRLLACHARAERTGAAVDTACLARAAYRFSNGDRRGCWDRLETRGMCRTSGDAEASAAAVDAFVLDVVTALDPTYPAPTSNRCSSGKKKCVSKTVAAALVCQVAAARTGSLDPLCELAAMRRFDGGLREPPAPTQGCFARLETKGGCLTVDDTAPLALAIAAFVDHVVCTLDPSAGTCPTPTPTPARSPTPTPTTIIVDECFCGDGLNGPCEACDPTAPSSGWAACGSEFACTGSCTCACPTRLTVAVDANDAATTTDMGWTGSGHGAAHVRGGDVTFSLACGETSRPCGTCEVAGPVANPLAGAGQLDNHRCSHDSRIRCSDDTPCTVGGGRCRFFAGSHWPLAVGGTGACATRYVEGVWGTADVETGAVATTTSQIWNLHLGPTADEACPRCVGDATPNDGVAGGYCSDGLHGGLACDADGDIPTRPDFGASSLDCPPAPASHIATLPLLVASATTTVTKTLSTSNPICAGDPSFRRCLCSTCNTPAARPCMTNADCSHPGGPIGPVCGGRRCIGGTNDGAPCVSESACAMGGGTCSRPGEPTKPNACFDDTRTPWDGTLCSDAAPVGDQRGECPDGPVDMHCANHPQRPCTSDADCDAVAGACVESHRPCFLDNGAVAGSIVAAGAADRPTADHFTPALAAVFCVPPTRSAATNGSLGLPGPARQTVRGPAVFLP